jgi:hypothetical protein
VLGGRLAKLYCGLVAAGTPHLNGPKYWDLVLFTPLLFAESLTREGFLSTTLLTRLHVVAVLLDLFDNVFRLDLSLEPSKGILQRFTLLNDNFCHAYSPPFPVGCFFSLMRYFQCSWSTPVPAITKSHIALADRKSSWKIQHCEIYGLRYSLINKVRRARLARFALAALRRAVFSPRP